MAEAYLGEIRIFAGTFAPRNWAFCDGQLLTIAGNEALASLLGTIYGGDGRTNFALPDLRGRAPVHQGQGPGLTLRQLGSKFGLNNVTLTTDQIPAHSHMFCATTNDATHGAAFSNAILGKASAPFYADQPGSIKSVTLSESSMGQTGEGHSHENMQPILGIGYIIAIKGTYPERN
jgi:microcystin-dependent protein